MAPSALHRRCNEKRPTAPGRKVEGREMERLGCGAERCGPIGE